MATLRSFQIIEHVLPQVLISQKLYHNFRCSSVAIKVQIGDENDNRPVFGKQNIRLSILENLSIGTEITQIEATDLDDPELYGKLIYSIEGDGSADFSIDQNSGQVKVAREIDYESQTTYNVSAPSFFRRRTTGKSS